MCYWLQLYTPVPAVDCALIFIIPGLFLVITLWFHGWGWQKSALSLWAAGSVCQMCSSTLILYFVGRKLSVPGGAPWLTMGLGPACAGSVVQKRHCQAGQSSADTSDVLLFVYSQLLWGHELLFLMGQPMTHLFHVRGCSLSHTVLGGFAVWYGTVNHSPVTSVCCTNRL